MDFLSNGLLLQQFLLLSRLHVPKMTVRGIDFGPALGPQTGSLGQAPFIMDPIWDYVRSDERLPNLAPWPLRLQAMTPNSRAAEPPN